MSLCVSLNILKPNLNPYCRYPMEIYLFFIDETLPAMASATILVVLVEVSRIYVLEKYLKKK